MCSFVWMWECVPICVWMHECVFGNNCEPIGVCSHASVKVSVIFMFVRGNQYVHVCEWVQMYVSMSLCNWLSLWVYVIVSDNVLVCCCVLLSLQACTFEYHHLCEYENLTCEWSVSVWVWAHMFQWIFKYVHVWKFSCVSECEYMSLSVCEGTNMFMCRKCMSMSTYVSMLMWKCKHISKHVHEWMCQYVNVSV